MEQAEKGSNQDNGGKTRGDQFPRSQKKEVWLKTMERNFCTRFKKSRREIWNLAIKRSLWTYGRAVPGEDVKPGLSEKDPWASPPFHRLH